MHAGHVRRRPLDLQGRRVLVVKDEALVSMMSEDVLRDAGAEVIGPATSVEEALLLIDTAAAAGGVNATTLDINLQGEMVLLFGDHMAAFGVPFVFTTGYGESCDRGPHSTAPILAKPFDPDMLVDAVRDWPRTANA
jgi:DNA-binding NtrC family response regulator